MKKSFAILCVLLPFVLFFSGCAKQKNEDLVADKKYTYSGESFSEFEHDLFTITINKDGTYTYSESVLSSYMGYGKWSIDNNVLMLSDDMEVEPGIINYFLIDGADLIFIEDNSSNFTYVKVKDGERFYGTIKNEDE